jgi:predicted ribosome quality control (RQC) complex YloA/Tae2 family protein
MDSFVQKKIIDELGEILPGALVSKIHQPGKREILFDLWKPGGGFALLISTHPLFCSIHLTGHEYKNPPAPPRFCQALRKHLSGKRIEDIEISAFERAFTITFRSKRAEGEAHTLSLVAELFGRHGNLILVDEGASIINALNIVTEQESRVRQVASGVTYRPLPPLPKTFLPNVTIENCRQILADSWDDVQSAVVRNIHGISKSAVSQMVLGRDMTPEALQAAFEELIAAYREGSYRVGILQERKDRINLLPVIHPENISGTVDYFDSANHAADTFFHFSYTREQFLSLKNKLLSAIRKRKKREETKQLKVAGDMAKLESFKDFGKKGELLKQCLHSVKKGQRECVALDYSLSPPEEVVIELDPSLPAVENMKQYFRLYKKGQRGIAMKTRLLPRIKDEIGYLDAMRFYTEEAKKIEDLSHLEGEMIESGLLRPKPMKEKKKKKVERKEPLSAHVEKLRVGGYSVFIGKNNRGNDHIVKNMAAPGDLWLHARHYPGSHVLIKKTKKDAIPEEVIYRSGQMAAARSAAAGDGKVEVFVADARDVRKIPRQKPGMVRIRRYKTIMVETGNSSS